MTKKYQHFLLLIFIAAATLSSQAQEWNTGTDSNRVKRQWSVQLGGGIGGGVFRDMGTAPIRFNGLALQPSAGLQMKGPKLTIDLDIITNIGIYEDAVEPIFNFGSYDINNTIRLKFSRNICRLFDYSDILDGSLSVGLAATNFIDVTVNPSYENASAGVSEFIGPELSLRAGIGFATTKKISRMSFHGECGFMPVAAILRPGYSYIDNYTATQPVLDALFDDYHWNAKPLAGIYTDIGIDLLTRFSNRLSLSYLWGYHTSGNSGNWRFDHASHIIELKITIPF